LAIWANAPPPPPPPGEAYVPVEPEDPFPPAPIQEMVLVFVQSDGTVQEVVPAVRKMVTFVIHGFRQV
jgi:hypothetical protein